MNFDLTDRQVQIVVQALRGAEKTSRWRFFKWLTDEAGNIEPDVLVRRNSGFAAYCKESIELRKIFGDETKVRIDL